MKYLVALLLLVGTRAAFAVDGQVLINQATVMAAGGFPYKITQPGSYKLSGNLAGPLNTQVIVIQSSHVTLDLNGWNVSCTWTPEGGYLASCITDSNVQYTDITVRNGSITTIANAPTFQIGQNVTGLSVQRSQGETIEDIHFDALGSGYSYNGLTSGINSIIRRNTFTNNASPDIGCPSLVEDNVNGGGGAGSFGTGCKSVNNVGTFVF